MPTDLLTQFLIIVFTPFVIVLLFQLSSYLNMTILSTGIALIEIEDYSELVGIPEDQIRMFPMRSDKVKFKIMDSEKKDYINETIFDLESFKILETNIDIPEVKFFELKRKKFAHIIKVNEKFIEISSDGNTFSQFDTDTNGNRKIVGLVTFNESGEPTEIQGKFKKYF